MLSRKLQACLPIVIISSILFGIFYAPTITEQVSKSIGKVSEGRQVKDGVNAGIIFNKQIHDIGNIVKNGDVSNCEFEFTNQTNHEVQIHSIVTTCGCTTGEYSRDPVDPGEKGRLYLKFEPTKDIGTFSTGAAVRFRHEPTTIYKIKIIGNIVDYWKIYPMEVNFGNVNRNVKKECSLSIYNQSKDDVCIQSIETNNSGIEYALLNSKIEAGDSVQLKVSTSANIVEGHFEDWITISTDSTSMPSKKIYVTGWCCKDNIYSVPKQLVYGFMKPGSVGTRTIKLKLLDNGSFKIVDVKCGKYQNGIQYDPQYAEEHQMEISIQIPVETALGRQEDVIYITVQDDKGNDISYDVPLLVYIQPQA